MAVPSLSDNFLVPYNRVSPLVILSRASLDRYAQLAKAGSEEGILVIKTRTELLPQEGSILRPSIRRHCVDPEQGQWPLFIQLSHILDHYSVQCHATLSYNKQRIMANLGAPDCFSARLQHNDSTRPRGSSHTPTASSILGLSCSGSTLAEEERPD